MLVGFSIVNHLFWGILGYHHLWKPQHHQQFMFLLTIKMLIFHTIESVCDVTVKMVINRYHESDVQLETIQLFLSFEKLIQENHIPTDVRKKPSTDVPKSFEERQIFQRTHQPDVEKTSRSHHEVSWEELKKEEKKQVTARKLLGFHGKFGSDNCRYICITPLKNHHDPEI